MQRVAQQYIRPDQATIVVVGDATKIADNLQQVAPVALFDTEGQPLDRSALEVRAASETFDLSGLEPMTLTYGVMVQGNAVGTATTRLSLAKATPGWEAPCYSSAPSISRARYASAKG